MGWVRFAQMFSDAASCRKGPYPIAQLVAKHGGGENWAVIASLIETCKPSSVESRRHAQKVVNGHLTSRIYDLLPWACPKGQRRSKTRPENAAYTRSPPCAESCPSQSLDASSAVYAAHKRSNPSPLHACDAGLPARRGWGSRALNVKEAELRKRTGGTENPN